MPPGTQIDAPPLTATSSDGLYWRVRPGVGFTPLAAVAAALRPPAPPGAERAGPPRAERAVRTWRPGR
ncbi:hypothetical protein BOQ63_001095 (plasmid) [Streptomyces viridifaciens]|nr:hypothetical protein BOQ63_001095 [Streptomyces viridifaciens]